MKLRFVLLMAVVCLVAGSAVAQERTQHVSGYTRSDGTVVRDYYRSAPGSGDVADPRDAGGDLENGSSRPARVVIGGYWRGGTYVESHERTVPDGIEWNNLSHKDDPNQPGRPASDFTRIYFARYPFLPPSSPQEQAVRLRIVDELAALGTNLDWQRHTSDELGIYVLRAKKARVLAECGMAVDWRKVPYWQLLDDECVCRATKDLAALGVTAKPQDRDCKTLEAMLARVRKAKEIEALGKTVDWREHSLDELVEIETKLRAKHNK